MKKITLLFASVLFAVASFGQTIINPGMEDWRTSLVGFPFPTTPIQAPKFWFGVDSLALTVGPLTGGGTFHRQIFKETVKVHSGSSSAKVMTAQQGDLGMAPGILSNAKVNVDITTMDVTFTGGTAVTVQPTTVTAWVAYSPGIDTLTDTIGYDEGILTAEAIATVGSVDSSIGVGFINITPSDTFYEVTAALTYTTTDYPVHTLRITFLSGGASADLLDSSTLYVDDVTMTSVPNPTTGIKIATATDVVKVYPNPAKGALYISGPQNGGLTCTLTSVSGQVVMQQTLTGADKLDISCLAAGIYLYNITDNAGKNLQHGKVTVNN